MTDISGWLTSLENAASDAITVLAGYLPSLLAALLTLAIGWLLARIMRSTLRRISGGFNRMLDRILTRGALSAVRLSPVATRILAGTAYWIIMFLAVVIAVRIAGLSTVAVWLDEILAYLPDLLIGIVIVAIGYVASVLIGDQVESTARAAKVSHGVIVARLAQGAILITALVIALGQIGVDVTFLVAVFAAATGALALGFSLAFGLGAKTYVGNLIGAAIARKELYPGCFVRIGDIEGAFLDVTATQIALETDTGRVLVPGRMVQESCVVIGRDDTSQGDDDG